MIRRVCDIYPPLRDVGPLPFTLFLILGLASATLGIGSLLAGTIRSVRLSSSVQASRVEAPATLRRMTSELHMEDSIVCIEAAQPVAFCYGLFRPMICVSRQIIDCLGTEELKAVLTHEREHLTARDPLRFLLGRALTRAFFMIPSRNEIYRRYVFQRELRADNKSIASCRLEPLASALLKLGSAGLTNPAGVAGFDVLAERIQNLTEPDRAKDFKIPWGKAIGQVLALMGVALAGFSVFGGTAEAAIVGCLL